MQPGSNKPAIKPGMIVRLTPAGPWRIGPDSGARNHVDAVYHSDSLYGAVSAAMERLGTFDEWLGATARSSVAAVAFSSCYPFVEEVNLVVPPRTLWPPSSPALLSSRVRWKSARFVPLSLIPSLVAAAPLVDSAWTVDGASQCLLPVGKTGPFRSSLRFHAAVDRLTGLGERHSVACLEFRPGAGLWTLVSFADEASRERWSDRVKAAFRLLADSGFGGERSQGWGHAAPPEFTEGWLPEMILPAPAPKSAEASVRQKIEVAPLVAPIPVPPAPSQVPESPSESDREEAVEPSPAPEPPESPNPAPNSEGAVESSSAPDPGSPEPVPSPVPEAASQSRDREGVVEPSPTPEPPESANPAPNSEGAVEPSPTPTPEPPESPAPALKPKGSLERPAPATAHWLLSLFTPAPADTVDWTRGNYMLVTRAGRVVSSGELKKTAQLVAEGSVLFAASAPSGGARDVAPDGAAHPVFRAGFAVSVPLPEVG
jgi:CRISPR type III-A-associated RAMP protein Csm4